MKEFIVTIKVDTDVIKDRIPQSKHLITEQEVIDKIDNDLTNLLPKEYKVTSVKIDRL